MDPSILINQRIEVLAIYKKNLPASHICVPLKMKWKNQEIKFSELGLRHPTMKGQRMVHIFDVSDGNNDYRLEFDAEGLTWTLISMISKEPFYD